MVRKLNTNIHKPTGQYCKDYPIWIKTAEQKKRYDKRMCETISNEGEKDDFEP